MRLTPEVTISVRRSFSQTNGVAQVERCDPRLLLVVVDDDQHVAVDDGGGGRAPFGPGAAVRRQRAPDLVAVHVERIGAEVAETDVDVLAVRRRGFGGVGALLVPRERREPDRDGPLPQDVAGLEVEAVDQPVVVDRRRIRAPARGVEARLRLLEVADGGDRRQEDAVAPDHGARPAEAGDVRHPLDVLGRAPRLGQVGVVRNGGVHGGAAEVRPVVAVGRLGQRRGGGQRHERQEECDPLHRLTSVRVDLRRASRAERDRGARSGCRRASAARGRTPRATPSSIAHGSDRTAPTGRREPPAARSR